MVVAVLALAVLVGANLAGRTALGAPVVPSVDGVPAAFLGAGAPKLDLSGAASKLEAALGPTGAGFSFEVVSRSTLKARAGGPKIEVPDPGDPTKVAGMADELYVGASIASGSVTRDGFFSQMRAGPGSKDQPADFANAPTTMATLVRDGKTWRNDGEGWYETDIGPSIGLDPQTVRLLPSFLRNATSLTARGSETSGGRTLSKVGATGRIADAPGLMAVDAAAFSELTEPVELALDPEGRLARLTARMRNTNEKTFDLVVDTVITFRYDPAPGSLPLPSPLAPPPAPATN